MKVIGAGLVTADITAPCNSDWNVHDAAAYSSGGTVTNILSHLAYWGWDCSLLGGVGDDVLGTKVLTDLRTFGVESTGIIARQGVFTRRFGHLIAVSGHRRGSHRFVERCFTCGRLFPPFEPLGVEEVSPSLLDSIDSDTVLLIDRANLLTLELARKVHNAAGIVIFEPGYVSRNRGIVVDILSLADVVKFSAELLWEGVPFSEGYATVPNKARLVIETRGNTGVVARRESSELRLTTTPLMKIVDTAGAGDAFMAGFLTGLGVERLSRLRSVPDAEIESALERGQAMGALTCLFLGATSMIRETGRADLDKAITSTMATLRTPKGFGLSEISRDWADGSEVLRSSLDEAVFCRTCLLPLE